MNEWLKTLAPTIVSMLGGPVAGLAYELVGKAMGTTAEAAKDIVASGQMTGDQVAALKIAEVEAQSKERELGLRFAELEFSNTKSAREMQVSTRSNTPSILTYLITLGFFGILGYMLTDEYKSSEPLLVMLGSLGTAWVACVNFWFGSSHGSMAKTNLLAQSAPGK